MINWHKIIGIFLAILITITFSYFIIFDLNLSPAEAIGLFVLMAVSVPFMLVVAFSKNIGGEP